MRPGYFRNRSEAGRLRAAKLSAYAGRLDVLVLVLPRGGVPAAYEVARALGEPQDVFLVRKLGVPWTRRTRDGRNRDRRHPRGQTTQRQQSSHAAADKVSGRFR